MASKGSISASEPLDTAGIGADVLEGCRVGDRLAQRLLYESFQCQVYRLTVRIVGWQDAEDVTQQVFLQVFRKMGQFAGHSKFETWLYRLAMNEALQHLRKERRWNHQPLRHEPMSPHKREEEQTEDKDVLEQALSRLEPELRSLFVLREVEGLSYREIAEAMGIPEGTVGSRLNRARRELQQHLADLGWEP
ncbi:MAG: RNA polymerase sigma factor [Planctomycetaceae bacterium]